MCARYFLNIEEHDNETIAQELMRRYKKRPEWTRQIGGTILPTLRAPVLCRDRKGNPGYFLMPFGIHAGSRLVINARAETAAQKPLFKELVHQYRCLIPATSYTEWQHNGREKSAYTFSNSLHKTMYFAALYQHDPRDGSASFVILTREAAKPFHHIHDRMPLILTPEEQHLWISEDADPHPLLASGMTDLLYTPDGPSQLSLFS